MSNIKSGFTRDVREAILVEFVGGKSVRTLAADYNLSIAVVEAVLRSVLVNVVREVARA